MGSGDRLTSMISLAKKAGRIKSGEYAVIEAIRGGVASLVIVAEDASDNTKKKFTDKAHTAGVPLEFFSTKEALGHAIGKEFTASIAVCDDGFADAITKLMRDLNARR